MIHNASVGQEYLASPVTHDAAVDPNDSLIISSVKGLEAVGGFQWIHNAQMIAGRAKCEGDFVLEITARLKTVEGMEREVFGTLTLSVVPDPRSLWKTIEPDAKLPFRKPDEACESLETNDGARLVYASKRGRSHAHEGRFSDDDGAICVSASGWSMLAVADGAGSCSHSRRGSQIAVTCALETLQKVLNEETAKRLAAAFMMQDRRESRSILNQSVASAVQDVLDALEDEAKLSGEAIGAYSTTLLLAAHRQTEHGHVIVSFWVGDGAMVLYRQGQNVELLGTPDYGEYAGQTRFLEREMLCDGMPGRMRAVLVEDFTALLLMTDGVSDPFFSSEEALHDVNAWDTFWAMFDEKVFGNGVPADALLAWLDFWSVGHHDDRTLALLQPRKADHA